MLSSINEQSKLTVPNQTNIKYLAPIFLFRHYGRSGLSAIALAAVGAEIRACSEALALSRNDRYRTMNPEVYLHACVGSLVRLSGVGQVAERFMI